MLTREGVNEIAPDKISGTGVEDALNSYKRESKLDAANESNPAHLKNNDEAEMEIVMYLEYVGGKASVSNVEANVQWKERFEGQCGGIHSFLQERDIFAMSGDNDCVTVLRNNIRKAAISKKSDIQNVHGSNPPQNHTNPTIHTRKTGRTTFTLREKNRQKDAPVEAAGKIAISCICQGIDLEALQRRFRQMDYVSTLSDKVLHVTNKPSQYMSKSKHEGSPMCSLSEKMLPLSGRDSDDFHRTTVQIEDSADGTQGSCYDERDHAEPHRFDLFVFSYGAIVWWGYDMSLYRNIEKEFIPFSSESTFSYSSERGNPIIKEPYAAHYIKDLFPVWCTFEVTDHGGNFEFAQESDAGEKLLSEESLLMLYSQDFPFSLPHYSNSAFLAALQRDHILLPVDMPTVKQAISHALAQSAKLDIIEPGVRDLLSICKPLPVQIKEKGYTNIKHTKVNQLKGQLFLLRMELKSDSELFDEPEFFWDYPWFKQLFRIVRDDYGIESRISLLDEKLSAVQLTLDMIGNQFNEEHGRRLEWIIIILILIEVLIAVAELMLEMGYGVRK